MRGLRCVYVRVCTLYVHAASPCLPHTFQNRTRGRARIAPPAGVAEGLRH